MEYARLTRSPGQDLDELRVNKRSRRRLVGQELSRRPSMSDPIVARSPDAVRPNRKAERSEGWTRSSSGSGYPLTTSPRRPSSERSCDTSPPGSRGPFVVTPRSSSFCAAPPIAAGKGKRRAWSRHRIPERRPPSEGGTSGDRWPSLWRPDCSVTAPSRRSPWNRSTVARRGPLPRRGGRC